MHLSRWLMVLCCSWSVLVSEIISQEVSEKVSESPAPTPVLAQVLSQLSDAQAEVHSTCASVGVVVPTELKDVLVVRRTIAADWQRKLADGRVQPNDPALIRFIGDQERLVGNLQQLANVVQQLANLPQRFSHSTKDAAYARYCGLLREVIDQGLSAVAARQSVQLTPADWHQRQSRHTDLLTLIESGYTSAERYAKLPSDDRQLADYRDQVAQARTTLEQKSGSTENSDDSADRRRYYDQAILDMYVTMLDARAQMIDEIAKSAESGVEADAPAVMTFRRATEAFVQLNNRRLALIHGEQAKSPEASSSTDQEDRQELEQERMLTRAQRLVTMASQWLSFDSECRKQVKRCAEEITSAPPAFVKAERLVMNAFSEQQRAAQNEFDRAITAADVGAALTAQQAFERLRQPRDRREQNLSQEMWIAERESLWRAQTKNPALAERLPEWDKQRTAMLAALHAIAQAEDAALAATHAKERAEWVASQAEERAQEVRQSSEKNLDLSEFMQSLDELIEPSISEE